MDDVVEIPLANGKGVAIVDAADAPIVSTYSWSATRQANTTYAKAPVPGTGKYVRMHRLILGVNDPRIDVDHVDRDGLNNRRKNLRESTRSQNNANRRKRDGCTSRFKGVFWHSHKRRWGSKICTGGKAIHLGYFASEDRAALAYDAAAREHFGEFARLNFAATGGV